MFGWLFFKRWVVDIREMVLLGFGINQCKLLSLRLLIICFFIKFRITYIIYVVVIGLMSSQFYVIFENT